MCHCVHICVTLCVCVCVCVYVCMCICVCAVFPLLDAIQQFKVKAVGDSDHLRVTIRITVTSSLNVSY